MSYFEVMVFAGMLLVLFIFHYKKGEEPESNFELKIIGYYLLGAFTFKINKYALPLGFLIFLFFFRPVQNVKPKQISAYLGLVIYLMQLIIPAVGTYMYERPRTVAGSSSDIYVVSFTNDWNDIQNQMSIDSNAHLENFEAEYQKDGRIVAMSYHVVSRSEDGFIYYDIRFSPETKAYTIKRRHVGDQWLQFDRTVLASRLFEVIDQAKVRNMSVETPIEGTIQISSEGEMTTYAIKHRQKYLIQGNEIRELASDELPITGYYITSCARVRAYDTSASPDSSSGSTSSHGCQNKASYFFDISSEQESP